MPAYGSKGLSLWITHAYARSAQSSMGFLREALVGSGAPWMDPWDACEVSGGS